jgi:hypothetical protein
MAKKTRRARQASSSKIVNVQPAVGVVQPAAVAAQPIATRPRAGSIQVNRAEYMAQVKASFSQEYHYVVGDLKRTGILAAALFAAMIAIALIFG